MIHLPEKLKRIAKKVLLHSGALRAAGHVAPAGAVILIYHSVRPDPHTSSETIGEAITHSTSAFDRQMQLIASRFSPITMDDLHAFLMGQGELPPRAVVVTFDDGFRDNFEFAAPILARHAIRATIYVTAGCVESGINPWFCRIGCAFEKTAAAGWSDPTDGRKWEFSKPTQREAAKIAAMERCAQLTGRRQDAWVAEVEQALGANCAATPQELIMSWNQLRSLQADGHLIGSHTMSHPNLAYVAPDEARIELCESKRILEENLGTPIRHFSYPCAVLPTHWNALTAQLTRETGYDTAVTTASGPVRKRHDQWLLPRVAASMSLEDLRWALEISLLGHRV
jgi:peptidoglycan/xylan/chitin deacetylase (PgdA/CDA1 family)